MVKPKGLISEYLFSPFAGEVVERSYTPVSALENNKQKNGLVPPVASQEGETIELMVKLYKDGKMSSFLASLKEGMYLVEH